MLSGLIKAYVLYPAAQILSKRHILPKLKVLKKDSINSFPKRLHERKKRLARMLSLAKDHVPYYRDLFSGKGFSPELVEKDIRYLEDLPYLTKDIVQEQGTRMLNESYPLQNLHVRRTGGSTGSSVLIYYSQEALDWTAAANLFALEDTGKKRHMKEVHFSSMFPETFPLKDRVKEFIKCQAMNRVNIQTDSFDKGELLAVWSRIKKVRPYLIQGHPSTLFALAVSVRDHDLSGNGAFQVFESTGEQMDRKKRETIEQVFGCRVFDRYGNAEFGVISHENGSGPGVAKVVDYMVWPETRPHEHGHHEIVLTGLTNDAMPLIRYCTGDLGDIEARENGFFLKHLHGRIHDTVYIGSKSYPSHYIQDLLDRIGGIEEFQLEQKDNGELLLRLVADNERQKEISHRIRDWWGPLVDIQFTDFNGLKKVGWQNKFRYVVNGAEADKADPSTLRFIQQKVRAEDVRNAYPVFLGREPENKEVCVNHAIGMMNLRQLQLVFLDSTEYQEREREVRQRKIPLTSSGVIRSINYVLMRNPKPGEVEHLLSRFTTLYELNEYLLASDEYHERLRYLNGPGTSDGVKIIQCKSIPRSGHHMWQRALAEYFQNEMGYCETYYEAREGCCKSRPCTRAFDPLLGNKYYLQKGHDYELEDTMQAEQLYLVQYRNPVVALMSFYYLYIKKRHIADTRDNFVDYYNRMIPYCMDFLKKWCVPKKHNVLKLGYEEILKDPLKALSSTVMFITGGEADKTRIQNTMWLMDHDGTLEPFKRRNPLDFPYFDRELFHEAEQRYLEMGHLYGFPTVSLYNYDKF